MRSPVTSYNRGISLRSNAVGALMAASLITGSCSDAVAVQSG
jgi:hypothetical protein